MKAIRGSAAFSNLTNRKEDTMGLFTRMVRLCKADMHGVMDQMEDHGLLLKQHLRDMETALHQKEIYLKQMTHSKHQMEQDRENCKRRIEKIEKEITVAIEKDKDDIARMLIRKLTPLTTHSDELEQHTRKMAMEIIHLGECLERQRMEYRQLSLSASAYFHAAREKQWQHGLPVNGPLNIQAELNEEEIELALLRRKEAHKGGDPS